MAAAQYSGRWQTVEVGPSIRLSTKVPGCIAKYLTMAGSGWAEDPVSRQW